MKQKNFSLYKSNNVLLKITGVIAVSALLIGAMVQYLVTDPTRTVGATGFVCAGYNSI